MNIRRASLVVIYLIFMSTFYVALTILPEYARSATLYVGGPGPGNYTKIQDAIDAANPGDTIYVYGGTYSENIVISKTLNLTGENRGNTIIDGGGTGDVVYVTASWVNVTEFTITNSGSTGDDAGIELYRVENCYVGNNSLPMNEVGIRLLDSHWNAIINNTASPRNTHGISLRYSGNNTIINNVASSNLGNGIFLYYATHNTVANNTVSKNGAGVVLFYSVNNTVANNTASKNGNGISLRYSTNNIITDNSASWSGGAGIRLTDSSSNIITNNNASWSGDDGIEVSSSGSNIIVNNTASWNRNHGIYLANSVNNTIASNVMLDVGIVLGGSLLEYWNSHTIDPSNTVNGKPVYYWKNAIGGTIPSGAGQVILANSTNVVVENQNMSKGSMGIELGFSSNNLIVNNTVSQNKRYGILIGYSNNNTFENNTASNNRRGIQISVSNSNILINNTVLSNDVHGIRLYSSDNNIVYHNNFVDNQVQATDDGINSWDNGYPSGGNYWSNYSGIDNRSGPNQDLPGSDGIGDTPYLIDGDSKDRYPLISALGIVHPRPPTVLQAILSGKDAENVTLSWSLSPDDGRGFKIVSGYRILRNMTYDLEGQGYQSIASFPNGTTEFVDILAGNGNPNNYFYQVCAVDLNNNTSCATNQVAKFTRPLSEGPNLVSIPLIQSNESTETVLQTVSFDSAWSYDSFNQEWMSFSKSKPYQSLRQVNHTIGLWINVTEGSNLTLAGLVPAQTTIHLHKGWNLVGFPSFDYDYKVADFKASVVARGVEGFDAMNPPYFLRVLQNSDTFSSGQGFWIDVDNGATWIVRAA
ncbi:MAG: NosD domain-containing protein [Thermoplasmata archaeon]